VCPRPWLERLTSLIDEKAATIAFIRGVSAQSNSSKACIYMLDAGRERESREKVDSREWQRIAFVWTRPHAHAPAGHDPELWTEKKRRETASDVYLSGFLRLSRVASGVYTSALVKFAPRTHACTHARTHARRQAIYERAACVFFAFARLAIRVRIRSAAQLGFGAR